MRSLILVAALAAPAAAQPSVTPPDPPAAIEEHEWYGYWTLAADAGAIAIGAATESAPVFIGGYALGGPMIHLGKQNYLGAALSAAVRVALPLGLGYWGRLDDESEPLTGSGHVDEQSYGISNEASGIILGVIAASLLDAFVLARRTVVVEPPAPSWTLGVTATNGVAVSLAGRW